MPALTGAG